MYNKRIESLRNLMADRDLDGVFLVGDANRNYMSGFTGDESFSLITRKEAVFITDSRFTEQARNQVKSYEVMQYSNSIQDFLAGLVSKLNVKKLGFEEDVLTVALYDSYKEKLSCEMVPLNGLIEQLRIIKDSDEVEKIRKAAEIADKAFDHMKEFIKPGMTEREVGLELEFFMKKLGATALSFPSIVASGVRSSLPHGAPTEKVINSGEFLTLDYGCVYQEYCSDMTRTFVIGKPSEKMIDIYNTVLEAQQRALEAVKAGIAAKDVDKVGRDYITEKGYGDYFGHGLGHGVGRQIHENPRVSPKSDFILQSGMIITDEPGVYIPQFGGVRIEDLLLVTDDGYEVLSKSPKNLIIL